MKKQLLLFLLLVAALAVAQAQAPGYLGKRLFVKPQTSVMFALSRPTASNRGLAWNQEYNYGNAKSSLGFNTRPAVQVGYALTRRRVLALEVGYIKTGMELEGISTPSLVIDGGTDYHYLFYHLSGLEYDLSWQMYNPQKGSLAPMGFYSAWHLKAAPMKGKVMDKQTTYASESASGNAPFGIDARYTHWNVGLEVGQHLILFDRLMLSLSAELDVPPLRLILEENSSGGSNQQSFRYAAFDRMKGFSTFMVKFGAGYLL